MSKFEIMQICGECGGVGEVIPAVPLGTLDDSWPARITCPTCDGSGEEVSDRWIMLNKLETKINKIVSNTNSILAKLQD